MGITKLHALEGPVAVEGSQGRRAGATPIQAVGSTVTYLKRTLIRMVLALVTADDPEDNDGNGVTSGNGTRPDAVTDWVDRFEMAVNALTDSDAAKELMERETVVRQITAMPHGPQRQRFMGLRQQVTTKWLTKPAPDLTPPGDTDTGDAPGNGDVEHA